MDTELALAKLSRDGHRITRQRTLIVDSVMGNKCLQSAEEIYDKCKKLDCSISYPTIYRTLEVLVESGLVRKLHFGQGRSWFERVQGGHHHHHLVCQNCGVKVPIDACPQELIGKVAKKNGFKVLDHHFEILGICEGCAR